MRTYLPIARGTYMVGMVYRFGFLFTILGNIVYLGVAYYLWKSIYLHADTIRGLTFNETFLYVGLGSAVFILLKTYADWIIHYEIREGAIAMYLTKPVDFQLYALFANLGSLLMNLTAITIPTVLILAFAFRVHVSLGPGLFLFPLSLLLASLVSFSIDYMVGLTAFYSESVWGISTTKEIIVSVFSGALIPLQFFPDAITAGSRRCHGPPGRSASTKSKSKDCSWSFNWPSRKSPAAAVSMPFRSRIVSNLSLRGEGTITNTFGRMGYLLQGKEDGWSFPV